jgi:dATP/dGTP pyrophosphohydrolase
MDWITQAISIMLWKQRTWSRKTFGPGPRTKGIIDHIEKEIEELWAAEDDDHRLKEWIDIVILGLDGAWRAGFTPDEVAEALRAKYRENEEREWPDWRTADPDKAIEHVRAPEADGTLRIEAPSGAVYHIKPIPGVHPMNIFTGQQWANMPVDDRQAIVKAVGRS